MTSDATGLTGKQRDYMRMNDPQGLLWNNSWLRIDRQLLEQRRKQGVEAFFNRAVTR